MMRRHVCAFVWEGVAVGKGRPRATMRGGHASMYTPAKTVAYELDIGLHAKAAMDGRSPNIGDPIALEVIVLRKPAASTSARKAAALRGRCVTGKPDLDNVLKAIADALNGVAYADDAQISDVMLTRRWGSHDEVAVRVWAIDEDAA